jgi:hypothetical protein
MNHESDESHESEEHDRLGRTDAKNRERALPREAPLALLGDGTPLVALADAEGGFHKEEQKVKEEERRGE